MLRQLTSLCVVLCLCSATTRADVKSVPAEVRQLKGKLVKIYQDVDLTGAGPPSSLHTQYLVMLLEQAGAKIVRGDPDEQKDDKKPDVVIFGDAAPPPTLTPDEARDPFVARKTKIIADYAKRYQADRPALERDAAAAGSRVIRSKDVPAALGIRATEPQMIEALDARAREMLKIQIPEARFQAVGLTEVISFLRDVSGANIFVNWRALEAAGVDRRAPVNVNLGPTPLGEVLDKVLAHAGEKGAKLGYTVEEGVISISTSEDLKKRNR